MDSLKQAITLREIATCIRRSYNALRNEVKQNPVDPGRGTLRMQHASLPLFRPGRTWLARRSDVEVLLNPAPTPTPAPTQADQADKPRRGRPRKSHTLATTPTTTAGGAR
jgi:hypothetical protein